MDILRAGGLTLLDNASHSYVFNGQSGSLDHALGTASLVPQLTGAEVWHINADEPVILDYNLEFKSPLGCTVSCATPDYFNPNTPFRSSDHDPVLLGLTLVPDTAIATIAAASAREGGNVVFTVSLSRALPRSATVNFATSIATGNTASATDFTPASGLLTFAAGELSKTFSVATTQDQLVEASETFTVTLTNPTGGIEFATTPMRSDVALGTITDDDSATVTLTNQSVAGVSGTANIVFAAQNGCSVAVNTQRFVAANAVTLTTPAPSSSPPNASLPMGVYEFDLTTCPGGSVRVSITWPQPFTSVWKWGYATPSATEPSWFVMPGTTIVGNTATFTVTDGGVGDNDRSLNGRIVDPVAAANTLPAAPIPTLPLSGLVVLVISMVGLVARRRVAGRTSA